MDREAHGEGCYLWLYLWLMCGTTYVLWAHELMYLTFMYLDLWDFCVQCSKLGYEFML